MSETGDNNNENSIKHQHEVLKYSVEQFDKNILFIASGALAGSFAFIKDIVGDLSHTMGKFWLILSWYFFAVVIFISLINHFISVLAHTKSIKYTKYSNKKFNRKIKKWNFVIRGLNVSMIVLLLVGTLLLINFVNKNI